MAKMIEIEFAMRYLSILFLMIATSAMPRNGQESDNRENTIKADFVGINDVEEVVKDSSRLAIEARSRQVWKRSLLIPAWG